MNVLLLVIALAATQQPVMPAQQKANDAFMAQKWADAAASYERRSRIFVSRSLW